MSQDLSEKTVLVADDDVEILGLVTRHLKTHDMKILEASDGEEALKATLVQRFRAPGHESSDQ